MTKIIAGAVIAASLLGATAVTVAPNEASAYPYYRHHGWHRPYYRHYGYRYGWHRPYYRHYGWRGHYRHYRHW